MSPAYQSVTSTRPPECMASAHLCVSCDCSCAQYASVFALYALQHHNMQHKVCTIGITAFAHYASQRLHLNHSICTICIGAFAQDASISNAYLYVQRTHNSVRHSKLYCLRECPIPMIPSSADGPSCPAQPLVTTWDRNAWLLGLLFFTQ